MKNKRAFQYFVQRIKSLRWIDLAGIAIFLAILSVAFFFFLRRADYAYITLRVSHSDSLDPYVGVPPVWYIEKIQPGVQETDGLGQATVIVEKVHRFKSSDVNQNLYVELKVKSVYNDRTKQYSYNGSPLLIGSYQSFKLQSLQLYGTVVEVRGINEPKEEKTFLLHGYLNPQSNDSPATVANTVVDGVRTYLADTLVTGLKSTDVDGEAVAEIVTIRKTPGKRSFVSGSSFISVPDPERQRVEMSVRVKARKINDAYYYRNESALVVASEIYLPFPTSNVVFTITEIEEK